MIRKTTRWGVDLGRRGNGKVKYFPTRQALEDWLMRGYDSCEGAERRHYEDMLVQLDDGNTILKYDDVDHVASVRESVESGELTDDYWRMMDGEEIDVKNLWRPTGDKEMDTFNTVKSWLMGSS